MGSAVAQLALCAERKDWTVALGLLISFSCFCLRYNVKNHDGA